ncbi:hypothetical protein [Pedobacter alluvionis]|uniref:Uncharacterized protein n=1 Tax=Pedobacter alluvionis TaxID=475253 RepID=A0A497XY45_9SPHI|nr:hypothetical protein [Pedobacter alluvionis]RLJ75130.1 hypothetical protein BCL90_3479 [Pedobacter alluvionis]TFB30234.1 hypothetical protein E3V97_18875 [Pedobacter alluvionis]
MKQILTLALLLNFLSLKAQYKIVSGDSTYVDFNTLDEALTCDSLSHLISKSGGMGKISDPKIKMLVALGQIKCAVQTMNELSKIVDADSAAVYQAQISFVEESGKPRALFNLIDTKTLTTATAYAKALAEFAPALVASGTGPAGEILNKTGITTALSKYSIEAYYQSALQNDPLIILYPGAIPGKKLSEDVIKNFSDGHYYNEVKKMWDKPLTALVNPINKIMVDPIISTTNNLGNELERGGEKLKKEAKKLAGRLPKIKW